MGLLVVIIIVICILVYARAARNESDKEILDFMERSRGKMHCIWKGDASTWTVSIDGKPEKIVKYTVREAVSELMELERKSLI